MVIILKILELNFTEKLIKLRVAERLLMHNTELVMGGSSRRTSLFLGVLLIVSLLHVPLVSSQQKTFVVNTANVTGTWNHFFERCVGSGHAALALRADYQVCNKVVPGEQKGEEKCTF